MAEPLKNSINKRFLKGLAQDLGQHVSSCRPEHFSKRALSNDWSKLELKQRVTRICETLYWALPKSYPRAINILLKIAPHYSGYTAMFFPEFVSTYGINPKHRDISLNALIELTQYSSSEFAVRPFIEQDPKKMMAWMKKLATHPNYHVRRLASEGCRPRLPWTSQLVFLRENPKPIFAILDQLNKDPELYVRKSVANNINDISKDNPKLALQICKKWQSEPHHPHTLWIIRHGLRSLIKSGDPATLKLLGYGSAQLFSVSQLKLQSNRLKLGQDLNFSFKIKNNSKKKQPVMLDYIIHHLKQNGSTSPKVFKGKVFEMKPGEVLTFIKTHKIRHINTRNYHSGLHFIQWQLNGTMGEKIPFNLKVN